MLTSSSGASANDSPRCGAASVLVVLDVVISELGQVSVDVRAGDQVVDLCWVELSRELSEELIAVDFVLAHEAVEGVNVCLEHGISTDLSHVHLILRLGARVRA